MHPWDHCHTAAHRFGGSPDDYMPIHSWFDASKAWVPDFRHRIFRHHSEGIFAAELHFGALITCANGTQVPTRLIAEQHIIEDLGWIPTPADYARHIAVPAWMRRTPRTVRNMARYHADMTRGEEPLDVQNPPSAPAIATRAVFQIPPVAIAATSKKSRTKKIARKPA